MVERKIQHVLDDYSLGRLCKPEIQRGYVWDRTAVARLFDSLYNKYPIGAFLFWKPQNVTYFKGLADQKKPKNPDEAILDGQQRLVSMIKVKEKETKLAFNIDTEEFEVYNKVKHKTNPIWIQVYDGLNDDPHATLQKLSKQLSITPGETDKKYYTKLKRLNEILEQNIEIIEIRLEDYEKVTDIFIRLNELGKPLKKTEIALALAVLMFPDEFNEALDKLEKTFEDWAVLNSKVYMKCLTIRLTDQSKIKNLQTLLQSWVGSDAKLKSKNKKMIKKAFEDVEKGVKYVQEFLATNFDINENNNSNLIPSENAFLLLHSYLLDKDNQLSQKEKDGLKLWTFSALHHSRYSGSSESSLNEDLKGLQTTKPIDRWLEVIRQDVGSLDVKEIGSKMNNTSRFSLFFALALNDALDWRSGSKIQANDANEDHHIFPKKILENYGYSKAIRNNPYNFALVSAKLNRKISKKEPEKYFVDPNLISDTKWLYSQFVPKDKNLWKVKNYEKFLEYRKNAINKKLNDFVSKYEAKL